MDDNNHFQIQRIADSAIKLLYIDRKTSPTSTDIIGDYCILEMSKREKSICNF